MGVQLRGKRAVILDCSVELAATKSQGTVNQPGAMVLRFDTVHFSEQSSVSPTLPPFTRYSALQSLCCACAVSSIEQSNQVIAVGLKFDLPLLEFKN